MKSVRGGTYTMAAEAIDFVLRVGSIAVLARLLVPEHFGLIGMVTAITVIAERFKDLGLATATVQRPEITHDQVSTLFWVNAGVGCLAAALVAGLAVPIARFYDDARLVGITMAVALTFVWSGLAIQHSALLRRTMRFGQIASIHVGASAVSIVVAIGLAAAGFEYWALVAREVARSVLVAVGTWVCCPWIPGPPRKGVGAHAMVRFGGHLTAVQLLHLLSMNIGQILIGRVFGAGPAGMYRQGFQLVLAPVTQLSSPIFMVSEPALSRLQDDPEKYRRFYRKLVTLLSLATMPLLALLAVYAEEVVFVLLGSEWSDASPVFRMFAIASFVLPALTTTSSVMVTCGFSGRYFAIGLVNAAALVTFSFFGLYWGTVGVAAAHAAAAYALQLPRLYWSFRGTPVTVALFFGAIVRPLTSSVCMAGVLMLLHSWVPFRHPVESLGAGVVVGLAVYLVSWLLIPGGRGELRELVADFSGALGLRRPGSAQVGKPVAAGGMPPVT